MRRGSFASHTDSPGLAVVRASGGCRSLLQVDVEVADPAAVVEGEDGQRVHDVHSIAASSGPLRFVVEEIRRNSGMRRTLVSNEWIDEAHCIEASHGCTRPQSWTLRNVPILSKPSTATNSVRGAQSHGAFTVGATSRMTRSYENTT